MQQGQGLGRTEQGMSRALSVEKTSKRGGRIVHEKDRLMLPPSIPPVNSSNQFGQSFKTASQDDQDTSQSPLTPPSLFQCVDESESPVPIVDVENEYGSQSNNGGEYGDQSTLEQTPKPSITELMRNPSKIVVCRVRNNVGRFGISTFLIAY